MYRILFVDDEALIRESISEIIPWEALGYELVGTCENGREAYDFLHENQVDVVLTDICMPFMDGMELSAYIHEKLPHVKVLILSGYDDFAYAKKAIKYGVEEYILKPITSLELKEVLIELGKKMKEEQASRQKQEEIYAAYRKGRLLLHSEALRHTITGTKTESECAEDRKNTGIEFSFQYYMAGVACLSMYTGENSLDGKSRQETELMSFIVYNLCQEIMTKYGGGEACQGKDNRAYLLFMADDIREAEKNVRIICSEIIEQVNKTMRLKINIALGSWQNAIGEVYRSYEEAGQAMLQRYTAGENRIIDSRTARSEKETGNALEELQGRFVRHVRECSLDRLSEDCRQLDDVMKKSGYRREEAVDALLKVKGRTDKLLHTLRMQYGGETECEEELKKAANLEDAMDVLQAYVKNQARFLDAGAGGEVSNAYRAYEYIEENYGNSNLGLQEICVYLGTSTSRFSSLFKQTFGRTFMEVLTGVRMEKAKEYLAMSDLKNYEIAEKVGFSDPHYFSIAFKKATGMTSSEYARKWSE